MAIKYPQHASTNYKMILPFLEAAENNDGHARFESSGFEPLSVEKLYYGDHFGNPVYSMMHWYTQNGDLMRDPDITFSVDRENHRILPLTYQMDALGQYQEVFIQREGKTLYSRRLMVDLDRFLWQWLKNIQEQGFDPAIIANPVKKEA